MMDKHDLHHEFPEYYDRIHELKTNNTHFARLFEEYHDLNREILRIEEGVENTTDEYLEELKKKRLLYKDKLYGMIANP
ncbi:MAG: YdcH family protein [Nitrosomonas sp.]|nr:YdcH family protein [Nitrosomonas sp.]